MLITTECCIVRAKDRNCDYWPSHAIDFDNASIIDKGGSEQEKY